MLERPPECEHCKLNYLHLGFTPDWYPSDPVLAVLLEAPGGAEALAGEPLVGPAGHLFFDRFVHPFGYTRKDILIANTIRCRPPGNKYPPGNLAAHGQIMCRQYDDRHGIRLVAGGIKTWDPNLFMITEHPAALFHSVAMTRYILRHMEKAFAIAKKKEWRLCVLMGAQAMRLVAPELQGGIRKWHGHVFEGAWPGMVPQKGFARI